MFGSEILDVALGLVLVFLLVSLVLTAVQEVIESWLRSRASDLNRAIYELLQHDKLLLKKLHDHPLVFALHRGLPGSTAGETAIETKPGWWPFSAAWRTARTARAALPSYIPRETFAAALIDLLARGEAGDALSQSFAALDRLSGGDLGRLRIEVQGWYDGAMDRASGWYKRRTQKILFWLGLATAVVLNINALTIGNYLATNQQARAYAGQYAERLAKLDGAPGTDQIETLYSGLQDTIGLPVGWSAATAAKTFSGFPDDAVTAGQWLLAAPLAVLALFAGYLITAFAAMLGAPFWFDVLNRIMVIRSTVKPREKSPDEPSQDGGRPPPPAGGGGGEANAPPSAGGTPSTAAVLPRLIAEEEDRDDLDGCIADHELDDADVTDDLELPPTTGGVETR